VAASADVAAAAKRAAAAAVAAALPLPLALLLLFAAALRRRPLTCRVAGALSLLAAAARKSCARCLVLVWVV
jgi:hypothetical protein